MWQLATKFPKSCHLSLLRKVESQPNIHLPSSSLCSPCYNDDNMANKSWTTRDNEITFHSTCLWIAKTTHFLTVNDFAEICICILIGLQFMCTSLRWCITGVCPMTSSRFSESFREDMKRAVWKIVSCILTDLEMQWSLGLRAPNVCNHSVIK